MSEHPPTNDEAFACETNEVTRLLNAIGTEDPHKAEELIPLVYNELRRLAHHKLSFEQEGQTLQATALVHEAYLRLVKPEVNNWNNRQHFFRVAAEAMRRILIDNARRKGAIKRGGDFRRTIANPEELPVHDRALDVIDLDEALTELAKVDNESAEMVKLRYFAGLTIHQIADVLKVSPRKADNLWRYAKAWLFDYLNAKD